MTNDPTNDFLEPEIAKALRAGFRDGSIATPEFSRRCSDVGLKALRRRELVERIRNVSSRVPYELDLPAFVREILNAAGVDGEDAKLALDLPEPEGLSSLNRLSRSTKETVDLLRLNKSYVCGALVIAAIDPPTIAGSDCATQVRDLEWVCSEQQRHIGDALESSDLALAAKVKQRQRDVEEWCSD
jgi:hypothetical protein